MIKRETGPGNRWKTKLNDKAASKIAGLLLRVQEKFTSAMNKRFSKLSIVKRKVAVACFCLIGGSLSLYYILQAVTGVRKENSGPMESFKPPVSHPQKESGSPYEDRIDEDTWRNVQYFEGFMDSLKKSNNAAYEKILMTHPGLMDSIHELEKIYYSQKIK